MIMILYHVALLFLIISRSKAAMVRFHEPHLGHNFMLPDDHKGGHGRNKGILHNLRTDENMNSKENKFIEMLYNHDNELHTMMDRFGTMDKKIADLQWDMKDLKEDVVGKNGGSSLGNYDSMNSSPDNYRIEEVERKLNDNDQIVQQLERKQNEFEDFVKDQEYKQKQIEEEQSRLQRETQDLRDEIDRKLEGRISEVDHSTSSRRDDMQGLLGQLTSRVDAIEYSHAPNNDLQNLEHRLEENLRESLRKQEDEQREMANEIQQQKQEVQDLSRTMQNLEHKVEQIDRGSHGNAAGSGSSPNRNEFEEFLRRSEEKLQRDFQSQMTKLDQKIDRIENQTQRNPGARNQDSNNPNLNRFEDKMRWNEEKITQIEIKMRKVEDDLRRMPNTPPSGNQTQDSRVMDRRLQESENTIKRDLQKLFQIELGKQQKLYETLDKQMREQKPKIENIERELKSTNNMRSSADQNRNQNRNQPDVNLQRQIEEIRRDLKRIETDSQKNNDLLRQHQTEINDFKRDKTSPLNSSPNTNNDIRDILNGFRELREEVRNTERDAKTEKRILEEKLQELERKLDDQQRGFSGQHNSMDSHMDQLRTMKDELTSDHTNALQNAMYSVNTEMTEMKRTHQDLERKYDEIKRELMKHEDELRRIQNTNTSSNTRYSTQNTANSSIDNAELDRRMRQQKSELENMVTIKMREIQNLQAKMMELGRKVETFEKNGRNMGNSGGNGGNSELRNFQTKMTELARKMENLEKITKNLENSRNPNTRGNGPNERDVQVKMTEFGRKMDNVEKSLRNFDNFNPRDFQTKMTELTRKVETVERNNLGNSRQNPNSPLNSQGDEALKKRFDKFETDFNQTFGWDMRTFKDMQKSIEAMQKYEEQLFVQMHNFQEKLDRIQGMKEQLRNFDQTSRRLEQLEHHNANSAQRSQYGHFPNDGIERKIQNLENEVRELNLLKRNMDSFKDIKDEVDKFRGLDSNLIRSLRTLDIPNMQQKLTQIDHFEHDISTLKRISPKLEKIDQIQGEIANFGDFERRIVRLERFEQAKLPDVQQEMDRIDREQKANKLKLDKVEELEERIRKLMEFEGNAFKMLDGEFKEFRAIKDVMKTVDFPELQREIKEFNRNKFKMQNMETELQKFGEMDLRIRKMDKLEREMQSLGNLHQINDKLTELEQKVHLLNLNRGNLGGGTTLHGNNAHDIKYDDSLLLHRVKIVEENLKKLDDLALDDVPLRIRTMERDKLAWNEKMTNFDEFQQETKQFILQEKRKVKSMEDQLEKLEQIPTKMDAMEALGRRQHDKIQRHEEFVNNFSHLGEELKKLKRMDEEWKKFGDVEKIVDKIGQMELVLNRQKMKFDQLDKFESEIAKIDGLQQELLRIRQLERNIAKFGDIDEFLKNWQKLSTNFDELVRRLIQLQQLGEEDKEKLKAMEKQLVNSKLAWNEAKEAFEANTKRVEANLMNLGKRVMEVEKLEHEIGELKNLKLWQQKLQEHWPHIENLMHLQTVVQQLDTNLRERTARILKIEEFLHGIQNLDAELKKLQKLDADLKNIGGIEFLQNRLQIVEGKLRTIDGHQKKLDEFEVDIDEIKKMRTSLRKFGDLDQFLRQIHSAQQELTELQQKSRDLQTGLKRFDTLILDLQKVQLLEDQLKKVRNIDQFFTRITHLEEAMESQKKLLENGVKEQKAKLQEFDNDLKAAFYNYEKRWTNVQGIEKRVELLENQPIGSNRGLGNLSPQLNERVKTLEDGMNTLYSMRQQLERLKNMQEVPAKIIHFEEEFQTMRNRMNAFNKFQDAATKLPIIEMDLQTIEKKLNALNKSHEDEKLHKEYQNQQLSQLEKAFGKMKQFPDLEQKMHAIEQFQMELARMGGLRQMPAQIQAIQQENLAFERKLNSLSKNMEDEKIHKEYQSQQLSQLEKAIGKIKQLPDLEQKMHAIEQFQMELARMGGLRQIPAQIQAIQQENLSIERKLSTLSKNVEDEKIHKEYQNQQLSQLEKIIGKMKQLPDLEQKMHAIEQFQTELARMGGLRQIPAQIQAIQHDLLSFHQLPSQIQNVQRELQTMKANPTTNRNLGNLNNLEHSLELVKSDMENLKGSQRLVKNEMDSMQIMKEEIKENLNKMQTYNQKLAELQNLYHGLDYQLREKLPKIEKHDADLRGLNTLRQELTLDHQEMQQKLTALTNMEKEMKKLRMDLNLGDLADLDARLREVKKLQNDWNLAENARKNDLLDLNTQIREVKKLQTEWNSMNFREKLNSLELLKIDVDRLKTMRNGNNNPIPNGNLRDLEERVKNMEKLRMEWTQLGVREKIMKIEEMRMDLERLKNLKQQMDRAQRAMDQLKNLENLNKNMQRIDEFAKDVNDMGSLTEQFRKIKRLESEIRKIAELEQKVEMNGVGELKRNIAEMKRKVDNEIYTLTESKADKISTRKLEDSLRELNTSIDQLKHQQTPRNPLAPLDSTNNNGNSQQSNSSWLPSSLANNLPFGGRKPEDSHGINSNPANKENNGYFPRFGNNNLFGRNKR